MIKVEIVSVGATGQHSLAIVEDFGCSVGDVSCAFAHSDCAVGAYFCSTLAKRPNALNAILLERNIDCNIVLCG